MGKIKQKNTFLLGLFLNLIFSMSAFSGESDLSHGVLDEPENCMITIVYTLKNGQVHDKLFKSKAKNEAECKKKAKLHSTNFAPDRVKSKKVDYKFLPNNG